MRTTKKTEIESVDFRVEDGDFRIENADGSGWEFSPLGAAEIRALIDDYLGDRTPDAPPAGRNLSDRLRDALALVEALEGADR